MGLIELFLIALGLSMDAFAVSVTLGLSLNKSIVKNGVITGLYFGVFQAAMPLLGYIAGSRFAGGIQSYDHWIAFGLLGFIGGKMIMESFEKDKNPVTLTSLKPKRMMLLAIATSIDALAVGVSFAFLNVGNIFLAIAFIGIVTFSLSMAGVKIGNVFGLKFKSKAEVLGGVILVLIGIKILLEHLGIL